MQQLDWQRLLDDQFVRLWDFADVLFDLVVEFGCELPFKGFLEEGLEVLLQVEHHDLLFEVLERGDNVDQENCDVGQAFR